MTLRESTLAAWETGGLALLACSLMLHGVIAGQKEAAAAAWDSRRRFRSLRQGTSRAEGPPEGGNGREGAWSSRARGRCARALREGAQRGHAASGPPAERRDKAMAVGKFDLKWSLSGI